MSHVFISYSRKDKNYVGRLVKALEKSQVPVWLDDRVDYGDTWNRVIEKQVEECQAFLIVMSPNSRNSHWVQCELSRALDLRKRIFPLLLKGTRWLDVESIQVTDVSGDRIPPQSFFNGIVNYLGISSDLSKSRGNVLHSKIEINSLNSEKGVNYSRLRDLLDAKNWKAADAETCIRMLEALGRNHMSPQKKSMTHREKSLVLSIY